MKRTFLISFFLGITVHFAGCETATTETHGPYVVYEHAAQVSAMPSSSATTMEIGPCYAKFETKNGKTFYIGSPGADEEVMHFVATLELGKTYDLPKAFLQYQNQDKSRD
jgi:hypothetical protein